MAQVTKRSEIKATREEKELLKVFDKYNERFGYPQFSNLCHYHNYIIEQVPEENWAIILSAQLKHFEMNYWNRVVYDHIYSKECRITTEKKDERQRKNNYPTPN